MITLEQYVGPHAKHADWTPERQANAADLLKRINPLLVDAENDGVVVRRNPATTSQISGSGLGGFRPLGTTIGAEKSTHKQGNGIDLFDPSKTFKEWCMANLDKLEKHGLWMEHPDATPTWAHLQRIPPKSGNRVYRP